MDELTEVALEGGAQTDGVVRVGDTVRRPLHARSAYVHAVLEHLRSVGFDGAPRLLGIDEQGREALTYVAGEVLVAFACRTHSLRARRYSSGGSTTRRPERR